LLSILTRQYYSSVRIQAGLQSGTLHSGTITISPYNFLEATVSNPTGAKPFLLIGRENINRAVHGDIVAIEILPETEWRGSTETIVDQEDVTRDEGADNEAGEEQVGDVVEAREKRILVETSRTDKEITAKVVGVVKRNWRTYVGHIVPSSIPPGPASSRTPTNVFLLPLQRQIPKIRIRTRRPQALLNQRVLVVIDGWPATSRYPEGHFVRALGQIESREAETEAVLVEWDVIYRGFSEGVLKCLPEEGHGWKVPEVLPDGRRDFRDRLVCSIDPVGIAPSVPAGLMVGCQDIDDALHARMLENGNIEVGVHIADVTHFVKPATPMDEEAKLRGTTVYLVDKRIDMLPMMLGTDLCSLVSNRDRYAVSVIWVAPGPL
jgi:exosome complex exonuclease DIS3/RRP44